MAFQTVLHQVIIMFILMMTGFCLIKKQVLSLEAVGQLTQVLMFVVSPCVIISSFQLRLQPELIRGLIISTLSAMAAHIIPIVLSQVLFSHRLMDDEHVKVLRYAVVYSNCGFMGIPLLSAIIKGGEGVFYASVYIMVFNLFTWTHGVMVFTGKMDRRNLRNLIRNPNLIAVIIGLIFFLCSVRLPSIVGDTMGYISQLNTPLAMFIIGARLADIPLNTLLTDPWVWPGVALRNFFLPLLAVFGLHLAGVSGTLMLACLVPIACPIAGNTVLFPAMYGLRTPLPGKLLSLSTLLSVLSLPLMVYLITALGY